MSSTGQPSRICVSCQRDIPDNAVFCPSCGFDYGGSPKGSGTRYVLPIAGGLAILVAGLMLIANGVLTLSTGGTYYDADEMEQFNLLAIHSVIFIIAGFIAVVGGLRAVRGRNLAFSLASGFTAIGMIGLLMSGAVTFFYAPYLALIGIILLAIGHEEFRS